MGNLLFVTMEVFCYLPQALYIAQEFMQRMWMQRNRADWDWGRFIVLWALRGLIHVFGKFVSVLHGFVNCKTMRSRWVRSLGQRV